MHFQYLPCCHRFRQVQVTSLTAQFSALFWAKQHSYTQSPPELPEQRAGFSLSNIQRCYSTAAVWDNFSFNACLSAPQGCYRKKKLLKEQNTIKFCSLLNRAVSKIHPQPEHQPGCVWAGPRSYSKSSTSGWNQKFVMTVYKLSQHSKGSKMGKPGHVQLMGGRDSCTCQGHFCPQPSECTLNRLQMNCREWSKETLEDFSWRLKTHQLRRVSRTGGLAVQWQHICTALLQGFLDSPAEETVTVMGGT